MQDKERKVKVIEKDGDGEKCRSKRAAGAGVLLVKAQRDPILLTVIQTQVWNSGQNQESCHYYTMVAKVCTAGYISFITFIIFTASSITIFLVHILLTVVSTFA